jgi:hypothetical protein
MPRRRGGAVKRAGERGDDRQASMRGESRVDPIPVMRTVEPSAWQGPDRWWRRSWWQSWLPFVAGIASAFAVQIVFPRGGVPVLIVVTVAGAMVSSVVSRRDHR